MANLSVGYTYNACGYQKCNVRPLGVHICAHVCRVRRKRGAGAVSLYNKDTKGGNVSMDGICCRMRLCEKTNPEGRMRLLCADRYCYPSFFSFVCFAHNSKTNVKSSACCARRRRTRWVDCQHWRASDLKGENSQPLNLSSCSDGGGG